MNMALALAKKGRVSPNPCVGAVVVKGNRLLGSGYHKKFGGPHAEVVALRAAGKKSRGGTLYVTLEPCSTHGKTSPCTEAILNSGVKRVVVATRDPNPKHLGKGLKVLQRKGIQVRVGVKEKEAKELIASFNHWIQKKIPYVIVKEAMTLDGKIATRLGDSKWISSEPARKWVHQLRSEVDAILVGKKTLLQDNPRLTARGKNSKQPIRILLASNGSLPTHLNVFSKSGKTWMVMAKNGSQKSNWEKRGLEVIQVKQNKEGLDLKELLKKLGQRGITSLLVEGGGETVFRFLKAKCVNKMVLFVAPKIVGGRHAVTAVEGDGVGKLSQAFLPKEWDWKKIGPDLMFEAKF